MPASICSPSSGVRLHQALLRDRQLPRLEQHLVGDADLPDVVQQVAVLRARVVEQAGRDHRGQLARVALNALRVRARAGVLRLERRGERTDRLAVRVLDEQPLPALELEHVPEVAGVEDELLLPGLGAHRRHQRQAVADAGNPLDHAEELERPERLAQVCIGAALLGGRGRCVGAGQEDDRQLARLRRGLQPAAELEPVGAGHRDVENDHVRQPPRDRRIRLVGTRGLLELEVEPVERGRQERPQTRIVVDKQ